jgi:hypothetical protein
MPKENIRDHNRATGCALKYGKHQFVLIHQGLDQKRTLAATEQMAITQMNSLVGNKNIKKTNNTICYKITRLKKSLIDRL